MSQPDHDRRSYVRREVRDGMLGCPRCGHDKPVSEFRKAKTATGYFGYCEECRKQRRRDEYAANPERVRAQVRDAQKRASVRIRATALEMYGGHCDCCGEDREPFLAIDHIDGGGRKHRLSLGINGGGGARFYTWLRKQGWPSGYRVLCHNCNFAIGQRGECPHQSETQEGGVTTYARHVQ